MKRLIMIMGVQRSGTTALFETLSTAPGITAYNEHPDNDVYLNYDLRPEAQIRSLLHSAPKSVLLKPVNESKRRTIDKVFAEYNDYDLTIVWLYRDPVNVFDSWERQGWTRPEHIGHNAYLWAMRNQGMLEMLPVYRERVIVVRYEDLLANPDLVDALAHHLDLKVTATLRPDSNAGRTKIPQHLQALIDHITAPTLKLLDNARTLGPESGPALPPVPLVSEEPKADGSRHAPWLRLLKPVQAPRREETPVVRRSRFPAATFKHVVDQPDPFSLAFQRDPHGCLREWRRAGDTHLLSDQRTLLLLGYEDVSAVLVDDAGFATAYSSDAKRSQDNEGRLLYLATMKRLIQFLTAERLNAQSVELETQMYRELMECCRQPEFDWVEMSRRVLPHLALVWMGVRPECVSACSESLYHGAETDALLPNLSIGGLLQELLVDGQWTPADLGSVIAGVENLVSLIVIPALSGALYQLLKHPEWMALVRQQPEQIPMMLAELLRLMPPSLTVTRRAVCPAEIGGRTLEAGDRVMLCIGAANRDPDKFDAPDELRMHRPPPPPIQYAGFDTVSITSPLAHQMCETVLHVLLTRFDPISFSQPANEDRFLYVQQGCLLYSPLTLMVTTAQHH